MPLYPLHVGGFSPPEPWAFYREAVKEQGQRLGVRKSWSVRWGPPAEPCSLHSNRAEAEQQRQPSETHASDFAPVVSFPLVGESPSPCNSHPRLTCPGRDLQVTLMAGHSSAAVTRTSACEVSS